MNDTNDISKKGSFFSLFDKAAFLVATVATFCVYFYTLGPSVGLEDSGELATASAHLGVPHPPGYPFWTFCTWVFCKIFSFVTYMGHPNPAWAVSLCCAVFGAFAAGFTAMLISKSAADLLRLSKEGPLSIESTRAIDWLCFGGGVAGALAFAFSPVEWSQSTIVEVYSLNSFFLMLVFLLSYRWMQRPSDKTLWITAFVFGLGLTNYQVLLFAIVPLAIIIALKNFTLCRDFLMYLIPVALTYQVLKIADLQQANSQMASDVINKHDGLLSVLDCPSSIVIIISVVLAVSAILLAVYLRKKEGILRKNLAIAALVLGIESLLLMLISATGIFSSPVSWAVPTPDGKIVADITAPLIEPTYYCWVAFFVFASIALSVCAVVFGRENNVFYSRALKGSAIAALIAIILAFCVDQALDKGYNGLSFDWGGATGKFVLLIILFFVCAAFIKNGLCYAIPVAGFHIALFVLLQRGALNGLTHPTSWWFWWPLAWNFIVLALAWLILPNGRSVAFTAFFAQLGTSFYAYMPIVSDLRNPPMNWGYPRTWDGFKHAIMRGQYEEIKMPEFSSISALFEFLKVQLKYYFVELKIQFVDILVLAALLPLTCWRVVIRSAKGAFHNINLLWVAMGIMGVLFVRLVVSGGQSSFLWQMFDTVLIVALVFLAAIGILLIIYSQVIKRLWDFCCRKITQWFDLTPNKEPKVKGVVFEFRLPDITQQWLIASGMCFVVMTLPLILLANVKGDLQDGFIQKVKFISSHAMVAMWIGYGLVLVGALVARFSGRKFIAYVSYILAFVMIGFAGITPIKQNYSNPEIVHRFGGSEQNEHTFGWQFGAYQLDGSKAIHNQILPDEEPLPDPDWPEPMEPYSIFFGGTDPGRFVPTYMIYGANFRSDIYLITQNALADNTYMQVQRDLYGDEIWIPSDVDTSIAFDRYVYEVQSGVRQANGALKIENGRVQVTGALGVMEINALLTEMMFEKNKKRNAFYVEESYAIEWMYPYLSPHGLIMKLNSQETPYNSLIARKDADFWDWYSRRLLTDPMYRRDFAAQKSFSKLRSAIAGLYCRQGRIADAAQAYREAHMLYPASPESTFRYLQDILMRDVLKDRYIIQELLEYTDTLDPNNKRTESIYKIIKNIEKKIKEIEELEKDLSSKGLSKQRALRLVELYNEIMPVKKLAKAQFLAKNLVHNGYITRARKDNELAAVCRVLLNRDQETNEYVCKEAELACKVYVAKAKTDDLDPEVALGYARLLYQVGKKTEAIKVYEKALYLGKPRIQAVIQSEAQYYKDPSLFLVMAKYGFKTKKNEFGFKCFKDAVELDPTAVAEACKADEEIAKIDQLYKEYTKNSKGK